MLRVLLLLCLFSGVSAGAANRKSKKTIKKSPAEDIALPQEEEYEYCIVGAGPGGLQLGQLFQVNPETRENYIILEKGDSAGSFWKQYPRHGYLQSGTKRFTGTPWEGEENLQKNFRSDWNSLYVYKKDGTLDEKLQQKLLMRDFAQKHYPHRDEVREYLRAYANTTQLRVRYNQDVVSIEREATDLDRLKEILTKHRPDLPQDINFLLGILAGYNDHLATFFNRLYDEYGDTGFKTKFVLKAASADGTKLGEAKIQNVYRCSNVIMATGTSVPRMTTPALRNMKSSLGYHEAPLDLDFYRNKSVGIYGGGNSALEWMQDIIDVCGTVDIMSRKSFRLSYQTHYQGDINARHDEILDQYGLKSHVQVMGQLEQDVFLKLEGRADGGFFLHHQNLYDGGDDLPKVPPEIGNYDLFLYALGFVFDDSMFQGELRPKKGIYNNRHTHDAPEDKDKYPLMMTDFQSTNVDGLFFAGALMHSLDYRRSNGGFISGFRHLCKSLNNMLLTRARKRADVNAKNHKTADKPALAKTGGWKVSGIFPTINDADIVEVSKQVIRRLEVDPVLVQMHGDMSDVVILCKKMKTAVHIPGVPRLYLMSGPANLFGFLQDIKYSPLKSMHDACVKNEIVDVITLTLERGKSFKFDATLARGRKSGLRAEDAHKANTLHPVVRYYKLPVSPHILPTASRQDNNNNEGNWEHLYATQQMQRKQKRVKQDVVQQEAMMIGEVSEATQFYHPYAGASIISAAPYLFHKGVSDKYVSEFKENADLLSCTQTSCFVKFNASNACGVPVASMSAFQQALQIHLESDEKAILDEDALANFSSGTSCTSSQETSLEERGTCADATANEQNPESKTGHPLRAAERLQVQGEGAYTMAHAMERQLGLEAVDPVYYTPIPVYPRPCMLIHLAESVLDRWNTELHHIVPLTDFFRSAISL